MVAEVIARSSKVAVAASLASLFSLVVFGNLTDYGTNFTFVGHVMSMDTVFPFAGTKYRAVTSPMLHHLTYALIIATEVVAAALTWRGAWRMAQSLRAPDFAAAKADAIVGLTVALALWQVGLIGLGSEWFGMWMSKEWSGLDNAFRYAVMTLGAMIYLVLPEDATLSTTAH